MEKKQAFKNLCCEYTLTSKKNRKDLELFLVSKYNKLSEILRQNVKKHGHIKFILFSHCKLFKLTEDKIVTISPYFPSEVKILYSAYNIKNKLRKAFAEILGIYDGFVELSSGWVLEFVDFVQLNIAKYQPFKGGCKNKQLPEFIRRKKACISFDCIDNKCFLYAVLASVYPVSSNKNRHTLYRLVEHNLNTDSLSYPVSFSQINSFEKDNNISINVFGCSLYNKVVPLYITTFKNATSHVNLFFHQKHYYCISNLSALLSKQYNKYQRKLYYCNYCLCYFLSQQRLKKHASCCTNRGQMLEMPPEMSFMKFKNFHKQVPVPFLIAADFETIQCSEIQGQRKCIARREHQAIAFGAIRVSEHEEYNGKLVTYIGKNCVEKFLYYLEKQWKIIENILYNNKCSMIYDQDDMMSFQKASVCYLCNKKLMSFQKMRDHCHLTGKFRGAACLTCNLVHSSISNLKIPVIFHGGENFDFNLIIQKLYKLKQKKLYIIPKNSEKILSFTLNNFIFIDTYKHLSSSLANLCDILKEKGVKYFHHTRAHFSNDKQFHLAMRKGVFCYDYVDSIRKLVSKKSLPSSDQFYDKLNDKSISEDDYKFAVKVWKSFKCRSLADYMKIYLETDVLILVDVFQNYRRTCRQWYGLDPAHYISVPQLSEDAFLKMTKCKLELISDVDMYHFFTSALRGGFSCVISKYDRANNPLCPGYDQRKPINYLINIDQTNLYGFSMMQKLPYRNFRWMTQSQIKQLNLYKLDQDPDVGYMLEVTLVYDSCLHKKHNCFPLAPQKKKIEYSQLSPTAKEICDKFKLKPSLNSTKLIADFSRKEKYILHYKNLMLYMKLGLRVVKVHRVISFDQKAIVKKFIKFNTMMRKQANNPFEVQFFKLLNNSLYGKTLQSPLKYCNTYLVSESEKFVKLTSKPNFKSFKIINDKLVTVHMTKPTVFLNRPIYLGVSILELSKCKMYHFYYNILMKKYGHQNLKLLYTDTDSFILSIKTEDLYKDLQSMSQYFDFSNYPEDHFLYDICNAKTVGTMKDETASVPILEFVALRSKMYSILLSNDDNFKTAKGVKRSSLHKLRHEDYISALQESKQTETEYYSIISKNHRLYTSHQKKTGLSPFDDKRYLETNKIDTLAYFHFKTKLSNKRELGQSENTENKKVKTLL
jgi:hypothetical protein